jgi:hypothetical protein
MEISPIAIALDTNNVVAYLVIGAQRATNEEAGRVKATGGPNGTIRPTARAPSVAATTIAAAATNVHLMRLPLRTSNATSDAVFDYCAITPLTLSPRTMHQLRRIEVVVVKSAFDPSGLL